VADCIRESHYNPARLSRFRFWPLAGTALFIFYCTAVGVYLLLRPWSPARPAFGIGASAYFRGFVSGLGLIHLAAAFVDLKVLSRLISEEPSAQAPAP
jgi:hypothetical protein